MRLKQKLAVMLAAFLILLQGFPALAVLAENAQALGANTMQQDSDAPPDSENKPSDILPEPEPSTPEQPDPPSDTDAEPDPETPGNFPGQSLPEDGELEEDTQEPPSAVPLPAGPIIPPEEPSESPVLSAEIVEDGENPGLYITLTELPKNADRILLHYSFNGKNYSVRLGDWQAEDLEIDVDSATLLVCGIDEFPLSGYLSGEVENLFLKAEIYPQGDLVNSLFTEPFLFSHNRTYAVPETPPPFSVEIQFGWWTYSLYGNFSDFPPNVDKVLVNYSWDGVNYRSINPDDGAETEWFLQNLGHPDPVEREKLEHQEIGIYLDDPLKSLFALEQDSFYVQLEIHTQDGQVYNSQAAKYERSDVMPLPEHLTPRVEMSYTAAVYDFETSNPDTGDDDESLPPSNFVSSYGQYQITVPEDASPAEIAEALPYALPVRVSLWDKNTKTKYGFADIECAVDWKSIPSMSLVAGAPVTISDAAEPLVIPAGTEIETSLGTYLLTQPLTFRSAYNSDTIQLVINPIAKDAAPEVVLRACDISKLSANGDYYQLEGDVEELIGTWTPLSVIFMQKPTGATAIHACAVSGDERVSLGDLLDSKLVNSNQARVEYGDIAVLQPEDPIYSDYLAGTIAEFSIELRIEGGVFDGKVLSVAWPGEYALPAVLPVEGGNAGNENNVGSGYEEIEDNDSSGDGGQRPSLPDEVDPPMTTPVPEPPAPPENGSGDGGQEHITPPENGGGIVLPFPPLDLILVPPTAVIDDGALPASSKPIIHLQPAEVTVLPNKHGSALFAEDKPKNSEAPATAPALPPVEAVNAQASAQEPLREPIQTPKEDPSENQPPQKTDANTFERQIPGSAGGGLPAAATVVLLCGGITAAAVGGSSSAAGTGIAAKLRQFIKKIFGR